MPLRILLKKLKTVVYPCTMPTLLKYGTNLTKKARQGKLGPVIGRQNEIGRLIGILCCKTNNNPYLVGKSWVGKTTVVEGLAMIIANPSCPKILSHKQVFSFDMGRLARDSSSPEEFKESLNELVNEVKESRGAVILFIEDLQSLIGDNEGGKIDAANILGSALACGEITCISTSRYSYDHTDASTGRNSAWKRRFQPVEVHEPSITEIIEILKGLKRKYEAYHGIEYTDMALQTAVDLSKQHSSGMDMPLKVIINLIDEAGARVKICKINHIVTEEDIKELATCISIPDGKPVEEPAEKPVEKISDEEAIRLLGMETTFRLSLIGQDEAISAVSRAIRRARVGLRDQDQPIATFIFTGPTGVGKTQLAKLLSAEFFKSKEAMVRIDMSEYMEEYTVSRLIGSPPGYIGHERGGQLTGQVRERPNTVVLFDEIEKAHPKVFNVLLQILDDGRLTDGQGKTTDFTNTIIIMTSNIGGQVTGGNPNEVKTEVESQLSTVFRPEFLNRIDEVIVFQPLQEAQVRTILDVMLVDFCKKVEKMNIPIEISSNMKDKLLSEGFNPKYGARPLKRAITKLLEDKLAEKILNRGLKEGSKATVDVDSNGEVVINSN